MVNRQLWQEAQTSRLTFWITVLFSGLGGGAVILQAALLSRIVSQVFLQDGELTAVTPHLQTLLLVVLIRALLSAGREVAANQVAARIKADLRTRLFAHIQAQGPVVAAGEKTGELTAVLTNGIDALDAYFSQYLPQLFVAVLIPLATLVAIFPADWLSGLVLLLTAPLMPLFMVLIGRYAETLTRRQWGLLSRMSAHFLDVLQGLTTLKLLGQSKKQAQNIAHITDRFRHTTLGVLRVAFLSALVLELLATLSVAIIAVAIGLRLLNGGISFQASFFILILAPEFYQPLRMLGQRFHAGMDGTAAAKQIFALLAVSNERLAKKQSSIVNGQSSIIFNDVHVTYPNGRSALRGVSFTMEPGETVALVGPSGAGKSTIAHLLLGFIQPTSGKIEIGDWRWENSIDEALTENGLRFTEYGFPIAWVPQRPFLFHDSIANNIRLGQPEADETAVITAAKQARLHDFITSLPDGYDTLIGERGARLSGGQAQRVALARAFLLDAPLVILDEPTAHLDPDTEADLEAATADLLRQRTVLLIAHRPHTTRHANKIVTLENGRVMQITMVNGQWSIANSQPPTTNHQLPTTNQQPITNNHQPITNNHQPTTNNHPTTRRLLRFLRPFAAWVALAVLLGVLTIGSSIGLLGTSAYLISAAALQPSIADLSIAIVGVRFFGLSRGVLRYLERLVAHNLTFRLLAQLRVWFYTTLEPLPLPRWQQFRSGDLLNRIVTDIETLQDFYVRVVGPTLVAAVITLGMALYFGRYAPWLGWELALALLLGGVALPLLVYRTSRSLGAELVATRSRLHVLLVDGLQGMADLRAFGQEGRMAAKVGTKTAVLAHIQRRLAWQHGLHTGLGDLLMHGGMTAVTWLAIPLVAAGQINGVYLAGLALMTLAAFEAVQPLPLAAQHLESSLAAARRLFNVLDAGQQPKWSMVNSQLPMVNEKTPPHLVVQNLTFHYPSPLPLRSSAPLPTLHNLTLHLSPGKKVAIVGPSGAGKTTLVNVLLRFAEYQAGSYNINGKDVRGYDADSVRGLFSVIAQDTYLFNSSIAENLRLAWPKATEAEMATAVQNAGLGDFLASLPQGLATAVGEQGMQLSGGERQRLAIARALLHNAPILVLDEPTANLDAATAQQVMDTIWQLAEKRTVLLITHRLAGLAGMDEIVVLNQGQVVERGTHAALLAQKGLYARWQAADQHFS